MNYMEMEFLMQIVYVLLENILIKIQGTAKIVLQIVSPVQAGQHAKPVILIIT